MAKNKRTKKPGVTSPSSERLSQVMAAFENQPGQIILKDPKKQLFSPELILRLAERIKKL